MHINKLNFEHIENDWKALEEKSVASSFFQTYDFHRIWMKHFPLDTVYTESSRSAQGEKCILQVKDGDEVIGIAPFVEKSNAFEFIITQKVLGGELVSDYGDIIAVKGKEQQAWKAIIKWVKEQGKGLKLDFMREESPSYEILNSVILASEARPESEWDPGQARMTIKQTDVAPYIGLPKSWDEYLLELSRHNRHEVRRKMRKVESEEFEFVCNKTDVESFLTNLFRLMRASSDDKKRFLQKEMELFFTELITLFFQKEKALLCSLVRGDIVIASVVSFIHNNQVLLYNSGFDPKYGAVSPGFVLKTHVIKYAIENRFNRFDFLRGGERYKYNLGGKEQKLFQFLF